MNTTENNKLIAEFMGVIDEDGTLNCPDGIMINPYHDSEIRFDESWDWLMPVVHKITTLPKFQDEYKGNSEFWDAYCMVSKESIYNEVVKFIKWYNENK